MEGRVEVLFGGQWDTVCNDYFDINAANVICRELGFPRANSVRPWAGFGQGSGPILLFSVQMFSVVEMSQFFLFMAIAKLEIINVNTVKILELFV